MEIVDDKDKDKLNELQQQVTRLFDRMEQTEIEDFIQFNRSTQDEFNTIHENYTDIENKILRTKANTDLLKDALYALDALSIHDDVYEYDNAKFLKMLTGPVPFRTVLQYYSRGFPSDITEFSVYNDALVNRMRGGKGKKGKPKPKPVSKQSRSLQFNKKTKKK